MRARVRFSVACMGAYVRVFMSACVRVSVARLHACVHVYVRGEATRQSTDFFISGH